MRVRERCICVCMYRGKRREKCVEGEALKDRHGERKVLVAQLHLTLCNPLFLCPWDFPGKPFASPRNLPWRFRDWIWVSCIGRQIFYLGSPTQCQAPLSMGLPRQEYWSELPFPDPGHLPDPRDLTQVSCIAGRFFIIWGRESRNKDGKVSMREESMSMMLKGVFGENRKIDG